MKNKKVARVITYGGLGNQLFQYSFAHYLTAKYESVILENTGLEFRNCQYMLKDLQGTCKQLQFTTHPTLSYDNILARILLNTKISSAYSNILLKNESFKDVYEGAKENLFAPQIVDNKNSNVTYIGVWSHWKYMYPNKSVILSELNQFLNTSIIKHQLEQEGPIAVIHVRRSDFTHHKNINKYGVIPLRYFEDKIKKIIKADKKIKIVTITDDKHRLKYELPSKLFGYILNPSDCSSWQAMSLMASARYVVASNSTFSWWGSVLALENGGRAYTPSRYFKGFYVNDAYNLPGLIKYENKLVTNLKIQ